MLHVSITVSKFLVTSGSCENDWDCWTHKSEVIDLSNSGSYMCPDWVDYPDYIHGATGGLIGNKAVVCGGGALWEKDLPNITSDLIFSKNTLKYRKIVI